MIYAALTITRLTMERQIVMVLGRWLGIMLTVATVDGAVTAVLEVVILGGANVITGAHFVERRQARQQIIHLLTTNPILHFIMILQ
jgi:hypothetical protein